MQRTRTSGRIHKANDSTFARANGFFNVNTQLNASKAGVKRERAFSKNLEKTSTMFSYVQNDDAFVFHRVNVEDKMDLILDFKFKKSMNAIELFSDPSPLTISETKNANYNTLILPSISKSRIILNKPLLIYFDGNIKTVPKANTDNPNQNKSGTTGIVAIECSKYDSNLKFFDSTASVQTKRTSNASAGSKFIHNFSNSVSGSKYFLRLIPTSAGWQVLSSNMQISYTDSIDNASVTASETSTNTQIKSYFDLTYNFDSIASTVGLVTFAFLN